MASARDVLHEALEEALMQARDRHDPDPRIVDPLELAMMAFEAADGEVPDDAVRSGLPQSRVNRLVI